MKRKAILIAGVLAILVIALAGNLLGQSPYRWRVYSNTQTFQVTIDPPMTTTYSWYADVHSGSNDLIIRRGIGGPTVLFVNDLDHDSSGTVQLSSSYSYHMGTDEGSLPIPGTCTWTVVLEHSDPNQQGP